MAETRPTTPDIPDRDLILGALADLGSIVRQAGTERFEEAAFRRLAGQIRASLHELAARLGDDEPEIELTDASAASAAAQAMAQRPEVAALMRRIPALMTAQQLAGHAGVGRARFHGPFAAIDGGLA